MSDVELWRTLAALAIIEACGSNDQHAHELLDTTTSAPFGGGVEYRINQLDTTDLNSLIAALRKRTSNA
jgi:hypothetical protein